MMTNTEFKFYHRTKQARRWAGRSGLGWEGSAQESLAKLRAVRRAGRCGWAQSIRSQRFPSNWQVVRVAGMRRNVGAAALGKTRQVPDYRTTWLFEEAWDVLPAPVFPRSGAVLVWCLFLWFWNKQALLLICLRFLVQKSNWIAYKNILVPVVG